MLTDNNQIFRNWFVIIHHHLTNVSAQIIQCIIFERNELSITLSTLWWDAAPNKKNVFYSPKRKKFKQKKNWPGKSLFLGFFGKT